MNNETRIFEVILTKKDHWQSPKQAWYCSPLNIPGSEIKSVYWYDKSRKRMLSLGTNDWSQDSQKEKTFIFWHFIGEDNKLEIPERISVNILLTKDLQKTEEEKNTLAEENLKLEKRKFIWAVVSGSVGFLMGIITDFFGITSDDFRLRKSSLDEVRQPNFPEFVARLDYPNTSNPENPFIQDFLQGGYPKSECGDLPGGEMYPIFIRYTSSNWVQIRQNFCTDAQRARGGDIQVASISGEERANYFLEFIQEHFDDARIGNLENL